MVAEAVGATLADAGVTYADIEQGCAGYVYEDSTADQRALYELEMTGVPIVNPNNNCAAGSSALFYARQLIAGGLADCVIAVGLEKTQRASLWTSRRSRRRQMPP